MHVHLYAHALVLSFVTFIYMKSSQKTIPAVLSLALLLTLGAGCGQKIAEKSIEGSIERETGMNVDVNSDANSMTVTDEESGASMSAGEEVDFPSDFPSDIPRYESGTLKMVSQNLGVNQSGYMMQTGDSADKVVSWFKGELDDWQLKNTMTIQGSTIMIFERDAATLSVTVSADEEHADMTNITVSRTEQ
jgi:hypothetical protein